MIAPMTGSAENLAAQIRRPSLLRDFVRKYVGTSPLTDESRATWEAVREHVKNANLTRTDVELAAHMTGLIVHPRRLHRLEAAGDE